VLKQAQHVINAQTNRKKKLMAMFNLSEYQTVQERIDLFWQKFPNGRLHTELVSFTPDQVVFKAECYADKDDIYPLAVDYAEERLGSSPVNKTSFVENCSTSALGRCISLLGNEFSPKGKRPSASEMSKVARLSAVVATPAPNPMANRNWQVALDNINDIEGLRSLYNEAKQGKAPSSILEAIKGKADGIVGAKTAN
jgi:hypothetical protein